MQTKYEIDSIDKEKIIAAIIANGLISNKLFNLLDLDYEAAEGCDYFNKIKIAVIQNNIDEIVSSLMKITVAKVPPQATMISVIDNFQLFLEQWIQSNKWSSKDSSQIFIYAALIGNLPLIELVLDSEHFNFADPYYGVFETPLSDEIINLLGSVDISHRQPQKCANHSHHRDIIAL